MHHSMVKLTALAVVCATANLLPSAAAEEKFPPILSTTHYEVKTDKAGDMSAAIKEFNEVLRKAKSERYYAVWRPLTGGGGIDLVSFHKNWAELDQSTDPKTAEVRGDLARISARINQCFSSVTRAQYMVSDLSLPQPQPVPSMLLMWTGHAIPGKLNAILELQKKEIVPALKSSNTKVYVVTTARFGAPSTEVKISLAVDNWAALDTPSALLQAIGEEKYKAFVSKLEALITDGRWDVFRLDKELSYMPAK